MNKDRGLLEQMLRQSSMGTIKLGRRLFGNSAVNSWSITGWVKGKIFRFAFPGAEQKIDYLGSELIVPTKDTSLAPGLIGGYYEKVELEIFQALATRCRTVLDVGGNIGLYAVVGGLSLPKDGRLYSFEPIKENQVYLRRNLALNHLEQRVSLVEAAVGDKNGELKIYLAKTNGGTHSASRQNANSEGQFEIVKQLSLDSFIQDEQLSDVDILKIDVEGFDGHVLRGSEKLLADQKPTLFIEYLPGLLKNCGFKPEEFIKIISRHYHHFYLANEPEETLVAVTADELIQIGNNIGNANLIVVDKPDHIQSIEGWISRRLEK